LCPAHTVPCLQCHDIERSAMSWPLIAGTVSAMCESFAFGCRACSRTCSIRVISRHGSVGLPGMHRLTMAYATQSAQVQARWSVGIASNGRPSTNGDKLFHFLVSSRSQRRTDGTSGWTRSGSVMLWETYGLSSAATVCGGAQQRMADSRLCLPLRQARAFSQLRRHRRRLQKQLS
jgi:hypothetical protein